MRLPIGSIKYVILTTLMLLVTAGVFAQNGEPVEEPKGAPLNAGQRGPELLRQLGLSREQIQQIRRLNMQRRPLLEEAQKKVAEANRALDEAIYADQVDETALAALLKQYQLAQAEVIKIRSMNELAIRKILTPEQLTKFRELRRRFAEMRERVQQRRQNNGQPGNQMPMRNRQNINRNPDKPQIF